MSRAPLIVPERCVGRSPARRRLCMRCMGRWTSDVLGRTPKNLRRQRQPITGQCGIVAVGDRLANPGASSQRTPPFTGQSPYHSVCRTVTLNPLSPSRLFGASWTGIGMHAVAISRWYHLSRLSLIIPTVESEDNAGASSSWSEASRGPTNCSITWQDTSSLSG